MRDETPIRNRGVAAQPAEGTPGMRQDHVWTTSIWTKPGYNPPTWEGHPVEARRAERDARQKWLDRRIKAHQVEASEIAGHSGTTSKTWLGRLFRWRTAEPTAEKEGRKGDLSGFGNCRIYHMGGPRILCYASIDPYR